MKHLSQASVAASFTSLVENEGTIFTRRDGARVAVIEGGPAGRL